MTQPPPAATPCTWAIVGRDALEPIDHRVEPRS